MSRRELERVEVMGRVGSQSLKLVHAAEILQVELPAREAVVEAVPGRWGGRTQTWACRQDVQPRQSGEVSSQGVALSGGEVFRERGGAVRAHAGGGTFGRRTGWRWTRRPCGAGWYRRVYGRGGENAKLIRQRRERKRHFGELVQLDG